jgi:Nucleotidyl transferase AbiEii toxin, Type IV TA system
VDAFHERLARIGLTAVTDDGLALAGGNAVVAHGFVDRLSADVDLFGALDVDLIAACAKVVAAYAADGLSVTVEHESEYYIRLTVCDAATGDESKVELVADVRLREPVKSRFGPVLHPDDVAAGKIEALFSRAECRDFIDVDALLRSGSYSHESLISLAEQRDAGFDRSVFAEMLGGVDRFPDSEFARYGISTEQAAAIRNTVHDWRRQLRG